MPKKQKISFALPKDLKQEMRERVIKDGYGMRGKSAWISEAIESLINFKDFLDLIGYSDEMAGFDGTETVVIDYSLKLKIEEATLSIRKSYPMIEGVKSRVLRTAVIQRILRT